MIHLFDNIWANSLIGLIIILIITIINLVMSRHKTMVVCVLDQLFFSFLSIVLFGTPCFIYSGVCLFILGLKKYRDRYRSDYSYLDYSAPIYSVSRLINTLNMKKGDDVIIGNVLPTSHNTIKNNMRAVRFSETVLSGSTLITGSSGSGKTHTMISIIKQNIIKNKPVVLFDYKGEEEILDTLEAFCKEKEVPYYEFSTRRCTFNYDPLINLNATGKVEAILNTRRWSRDGADEHYKTSMQLAIQGLVDSYDKYRVEHKDNSNYIQGLYKYCGIYRPQSNERDGYQTVIKMLEILLSSKAKELLANDKQEFSFQQSGPYVICFSFVSANKALASSLSSFIYSDIMDRGTRKHYDPRMLLCIDEFGTLDNSALIKDILEKGRSGGIQTIFSIQDINQIADTTSIYFVQGILGTINSFIFHNGATQQTAELMSGVQKYQLDFDIMNLQKPLNGRPPTALLISKYPLLMKDGSQEFYKIIPYSYSEKVKTAPTKKAIITDNPVIVDAKEVDIPDPFYDESKINSNPFEMQETSLEEIFSRPVPLDEVDKYL